MIRIPGKDIIFIVRSTKKKIIAKARNEGVKRISSGLLWIRLLNESMYELLYPFITLSYADAVARTFSAYDLPCYLRTNVHLRRLL